MYVSKLRVFDAKSMHEREVQEIHVTPEGFENDRRWMVIRANNRRFLTQRQKQDLARIYTNTPFPGDIELTLPDMLPFVAKANFQGDREAATIWDDECRVFDAGDATADILSQYLGTSVRLVYKDNTDRRNAGSYSPYTPIGLQDGYAVSLISRPSMRALIPHFQDTIWPDDKIELGHYMDRMRGNIDVDGCAPWEEDNLQDFTIGSVFFQAVKPCPRCKIVKIDQETAEVSKDPFAALQAQRAGTDKKGNPAFYFGTNLTPISTGTIRVGDEIEVRKSREIPWPELTPARLKFEKTP